MFHVPCSCLNKKFYCFSGVLFILFVLNDSSFFVTIMLVTWLEELRRQMEWQDHLLHGNPQPADPQPTEPFPEAA